MKEQIIRFIPMTERYPDPFEECLLLDKNGGLTAGCWISTDEENREGSFRQGRHGVYDKEYIVAWVPIEKFDLAKGDRIIFYYD